MAGPTNPLALQSLLGDINTRRAIAAALRAREGRGQSGEMVSGRYVPNLSGVGGALSRGLFGDPMDALRQEEQGALQSYGDELASATEGVLGLGADTPDADFARSVARGQTAGVPPEVMRAAMGRRQSTQMFDDVLRMLDRMGQPQPQQVAAGGGVPPEGVRGASPGGAPPPPPVGVPPQAAPQGGGNDAFARAVAPGGGVVEKMAGIPESKLLLLAATLPQGHPMGALVEAEIKSRKLEVKDGMMTRNGQFVGQLKDGIFIDAQGNATNLAGAAKAAQAGAEARAQEAAKAGFRTATVTGPDGTRSGYEQDIYGTPPGMRGQGGAGAAPAANPGSPFSYKGTVGGARGALDAIAADQAGIGGGTQDVPGGGRVIAGPNPMAVKEREAEIAATGGGREKLFQDQAAALSKGLDGARQAAEVGLPTIATVRGILDSGKVSTGMGANVALQFGRALKLAGVSDADGVEATQSFTVASAKRVMSLLATGALGRTQISDADRRFMERAAAADITLDEKTIRRVLDIDEKAQRAAIESHNRNVDRSKSFFQSPDQEAFYRVEMPAPASSPRSSGGSVRDPKVDQYLKQYGGQ